MKKLFTLLTLFVATATFAQLKVTENKKADEVVIGEYKLLGKMYAKITKEGEYCVFQYRDEQYKQIDEYKFFIFKHSDLDALYDLFANYENVKKGDQKQVELEDGVSLSIYYDKMFGAMMPLVTHRSKSGVEGQIRNLSPKQYKTLFGKK